MASALGGLGIAAAAGLPAAPALARGVVGAAPSVRDSAATASVDPVRSLFTPALGRAFRATESGGASDRTIDLVLSSVEDIADSVPGDENRFLLLFTASGFTASDGIYTLRRSGAPQVTLFLSAIGPRGLTRAMQAVVSRTA